MLMDEISKKFWKKVYLYYGTQPFNPFHNSYREPFKFIDEFFAENKDGEYIIQYTPDDFPVYFTKLSPLKDNIDSDYIFTDKFIEEIVNENLED